MQDSEPEYWQLVETFATSDIEFLRVKTDTFELVLSRRDDYVDQRPQVEEPPSVGQPVSSEDRGGPVASASPTALASERSAAPEAGATSAAPTMAPNAPGATSDSDTVVVTSPSVGVVYRAPSPDAAPYVDVGSEVEPGTTIALIEAMKVFTAVSAGVPGTIAQILVENNAFVEFGQPLFTVRTAAQEASA